MHLSPCVKQRPTVAHYLRQGNRYAPADWRVHPLWSARLNSKPLGLRPAFVTDCTGCILWQGATTRSGHAMYSGGPLYRSLFAFFRGPIPQGFQIHHECGTGRCVNLDHLTCMERSAHVEASGFTSRERNRARGGMKLTSEHVVQIKQQLTLGTPQALIARAFNVSDTLISLIAQRRGWSHISAS